jgi:predicted phage terminase large subunit-like protein
MLGARAEILKSHANYIDYFYEKVYGEEFIWNWHHIEWCELADRIIAGREVFVNFNAPPRHSKTEILVKMLVSRCFALNPKSKFISISASDKLVKDTSDDIKKVITNPYYQALFPYVQLEQDRNTKGLWKTVQGGGMLASSSGGQITGFGAGKIQNIDYSDCKSEFARMLKCAGGVIIDDSCKPDDADSMTRREQFNERFDTTIDNRRNNEEQTFLLNLQQRVHKNDLSGFLRSRDKAGKWNNYIYPAIIKKNGKEQALWKYKLPIEKAYEKRRENEFVFDTQYMQDPQPKAGLMFECENKFTQLAKEPELKVFIIDPADEGADLFAGGYFEVMDKKVYMPDVICNRKSKDWNLQDIADCINKNKVNYVYLESNGLGTGFKKDLNKLISVTAIGVHNSGNKHKRIYAESGFINDNFYFLDTHDRHSDPAEQLNDYDLFMMHLSSYTKTGGYEPDDPPDMLALASRILRQKFAYLFE